MKKVHIATSRDVGSQCIAWAQDNTPAGFQLIDDISLADIIICVMYEEILGPDRVQNSTCFNFHPGILPEYKDIAEDVEQMFANDNWYDGHVEEDEIEEGEIEDFMNDLGFTSTDNGYV